MPFGESFVEQQASVGFSNPYKFTGHELDKQTGLYYAKARFYSPKRSIFLSVDPLANYNPVFETEHYGDGQHNGGIFNDKNLNTYGYCYGNPVVLVDPNGKQVHVTNKGGATNIQMTTKFENNSSVGIDKQKFLDRLSSRVNKILTNNKSNITFNVVESDNATISIKIVDYVETSVDNIGDEIHIQNTKGDVSEIGNLNNNTLRLSAKSKIVDVDGTVTSKENSQQDMGDTFGHEAFHILGLRHPFDPENKVSDIDQDNLKSKTNPTGTVTGNTIKNNLLNSGANPEASLRNSEGTKLTNGQIEHIKKLAD